MCLDMNVVMLACFYIFFFVPAVPLGELVAVSKTKTLLLSAYQEHRSGRKEVSDESRESSLPSSIFCIAHWRHPCRQ